MVQLLIVNSTQNFRMKNIFTFLLLIALSGILFGQENRSGKKNNFEEWSKELNLSESQEKDIRLIQDKYKLESETLRQSGNAEKAKSLQDRQQSEIDAVLTPEQIKKAKLIKERKIRENKEKAATKSAVH